jgi:hypothetical protein
LRQIQYRAAETTAGVEAAVDAPQAQVLDDQIVEPCRCRPAAMPRVDEAAVDGERFVTAAIAGPPRRSIPRRQPVVIAGSLTADGEIAVACKRIAAQTSPARLRSGVARKSHRLSAV